ncbi:MAG: hypothetical protein CVT67_06405 [Actinobacteria bacterium HGW-Actinobacteria-7]|jgi:tetratricopeptide (TPR) repeat protein|nr:MAG: hypothetical protein CVT67_06405 [Actinobacteria bacterium HGW-Actinobacteria-7]
MRVQTILKMVMTLLVIGIVVVSGALLWFFFSGGRPAAPRTELERAVFSAEEAVKANPNDPTARIKLAAAYLEQNSNGRALEQAKFAVRLQPSDPSPQYVLGLAQDATGDSAGAIKSLTKAATTDGQVAQFYQDVFVALAKVQEKQGDAKGALDSMGKAIDFGPENILVILERAAMNERLKRWYDAAVDYVWVLQYDPQDTAGRAGFDRIMKAHPADAKKAEAAVKAERQGDEPAGTKPAPSITATPSK